MIKMTMYRATQNPDTPDLPFAQSILPTMYRDTQNPDTPDLPFAQTMSLSTLSRGRQTYCDYNVSGDSWIYGKLDGIYRWTESNATRYRLNGYTVVKIAGTCGDLIKKPEPTLSLSSN